MKPTIKKRGDCWEVTFGTRPLHFASIAFNSWERALEGALRGRGKDPIQAVFDERFLLSADRALQKMIHERGFN